MKKPLKISASLLGLVVLAGAGFLGFVAVRGVPSYPVPRPAVAPIVATPARLAAGEKLVLATCAECHVNKQTNTLAGHRLADLPPEFGNIYSANITQDKTHGIGTWTDQELVGLLRTGVGRDGRYRLVMPSFVHMSDEDVASIIAFLRSDHPWVKADPTPTHAQEPALLAKVLTNTVMRPTPLPKGPIVAPAATNTLAYGRYLVVGRYQCYDCHSKNFKTNNALHPEQSQGYLGGGNEMLTPQGKPVVSRNITGDADTGIGDWTEGQLAQALRFGQSPHGPLGAPMPKYSRLTDQEVHALYTYLQAVPKLRNATPEDGAAATAR